MVQGMAVDVPERGGTVSTMNLNDAATTAMLCRTVYPIENEPDETATQARIARSLSAQSVWHFNRDDIQGFAAIIDGKIFLVFRGTQVSVRWNWTDVLRNMRMGFTAWEGSGHVHAGYLEGLMAVRTEINDYLRTVEMYPGKSLVITGHSLGGATATLAAALWAAETYTFGAPKVGDREFAGALPNTVYRFVHAHDIAPKHPRWWTGYRHGGELWRISRSGEVSKGQWRLMDNLPFPIAIGILDHRVGQYEKKLADALVRLNNIGI